MTTRATIEDAGKRLELMDEELKHLNDAVFRGNVKPSLLARMEAVETRLGVIARLLWLIVAQLVAMGAGLVAWYIRHTLAH